LKSTIHILEVLLLKWHTHYRQNRQNLEFSPQLIMVSLHVQ
jgi:hypothetical protein